jgi:glycosyltransferase involved in cell wall biosynthesis
MRNADRTRFDYTVAVPQGSKLVPELRALDVRVVEMPGIGERSLNLTAISDFRKLIRETRPDVAHTHASLSARIAAKFTGKTKIIHTRHSVFDVTPEQKHFYRRFIFGITNNIFSDKIIAVSPAAAENLTDLGTSPKKITVVFNGAEPARALTEDEKAAARDEFGVNAADFICAIIARLEEVKGHRYILDAAKRLRDYPIKILVAGTGVLDAVLRELAARERLDNVIFTGFVREIYKVENIIDVQLNASYGTEATSLALLEGMSLSKPAIVSDFGGNPYVIRDGENGLVVPKRDAAALADAILRLYGDRALTARLGEQAKRDYDATFTAEVMARNTEKVYETT